MKALKINNIDLFTSNIFSGMWFDDNGGTTEGPSWLSTQVPADEAARAVETGMAELVDARSYNVKAMARECNLSYDNAALEDRQERHDWIVETLFPSVADKFDTWAYYSSDETFIVAK
jgi:hypothetical protein